jgi:hypothetical protein
MSAVILRKAKSGKFHLRSFCVLPTSIVAKLDHIFTRSDPRRNDLQCVSRKCIGLPRARQHLAMAQRDVRGSRLQNYVALFLISKTEAIVFTVSNAECQRACASWLLYAVRRIDSDNKEREGVNLRKLRFYHQETTAAQRKTKCYHRRQKHAAVRHA